MNDIKISICASAIRTSNWMKVYNSLKGNKIGWEIVFVGSVKPTFELPSNFKYIYSTVKPAQCYEIAFRNAQGELICWTADDACYSARALDIAYNFYKSLNNEKAIVGLRTVEDGRDITNYHRLIGKNYSSPIMTPFGIINKKLFHQLGGYDKRFVCGQSENDVVMRVYEIGGIAKYCDAQAIVEHEKVHTTTVFRSGYYKHDRQILEGCWVKDGKVQNKRLDAVQSFDDKDILTVTQSHKGDWK